MYLVMKWWNKFFIGYKWFFYCKGVVVINYFEVGGFICSNEDVVYFNLQFHFLFVVVCYDGILLSGGHGYQVYVGFMNFEFRGLVKIWFIDL